MIKLFKSFPLVVFYLGISTNTVAQSDSLTLITINEMANSNVYETTYTVGFAGTSSQQLKRYELLKSLATTEQLLDLVTHHFNSVVRLYSLHALNSRKIFIPEDVMLLLQKDDSKVTVLAGCISSKICLNKLVFPSLDLIMMRKKNSEM